MKYSPDKLNTKTLNETAIIRGLISIYAVGIIGHLLPITLPLMKFLTPFVLVISGLMIYIATRKEQFFSFWLWCCGIFVLTFTIEVIGVKTGDVFGSYEYGSTLGPRFLDVPFLIGWNWLLVLLGAIGISQGIQHPAMFALLVGILVVILDFFLEPVAVDLDYWDWYSESIPLRNYITWFLIGFTTALTYRYYNFQLKSKVIAIYFLIQIVFFLTLRLFLL